MMIQKLILNRIKETLTEKYKLDMLSADVRLAYVIYHLYMQEYNDLFKTGAVLQDTYDNYIDKSVDYVAFKKSIYRTLNKVFGASPEKRHAENLIKIKESIKF